MAPRPQDLVDGLGAYDQCVKLRSVRGLKNEIVGSKHKKMLFIKMGAVPRVVEILARESESGLLVQSAATVGSFAYGMDDGVVAILDSGGMSHLLKTLQSKDDKVVEAGVRSLKMIFQVGGDHATTLLPIFQNRRPSWQGPFPDRSAHGPSDSLVVLLPYCGAPNCAHHQAREAFTFVGLQSKLPGVACCSQYSPLWLGDSWTTLITEKELAAPGWVGFVFVFWQN
ncbi:unnamed protein product [Ostreobium quekettii]|uniref:Armadillo repeat-containing protein 8 n=1 Tax=Ostreobium quekettii TaxID=121088 RepID=A0A8S1JFS3_9CHLO|nr:unnamed protein product [Ostreobium quekettii]